MNERRYDIDWLRALAVALVIYWHAAMVFNPLDSQWFVKNAETSMAFALFMTFVHQWHMPLFFFLSGVGAYYSLGHRGTFKFAFERAKRLLVPLAFGIAVVVPPMIYIKRASESGFGMSFFEWYPHFYECCYPVGNFKPAHLWFIAYLLVFSVALIPVMSWLRSDGGKKLIDKLVVVAELPAGVMLFAAPICLAEILFRGVSSGTHDIVHDMANVFQFSTVFLYGYLFCFDARFDDAIKKNALIATATGVALSIFLLLHGFAYYQPTKPFTLTYSAYQLLRGLNVWAWIVAILAAGKLYLNFNNRILEYVNEAAYPCFIIHQTIGVAVASLVVGRDANIWAKYFVVSNMTLIATVIVYDIFIKRTRATRFLMGMNPKKDRAIQP